MLALSTEDDIWNALLRHQADIDKEYFTKASAARKMRASDAQLTMPNGETRLTMPISDSIYSQVLDICKQRGCTVREFIEGAIVMGLAWDTHLGRER